MPKCPVCEKENTSLLCRNCGFDGSRNYEAYPTLGLLPGDYLSVAALIQENTHNQGRFLHCDKCGSDQFRFEKAVSTLICVDCGAKIVLSKNFSLAPRTSFVVPRVERGSLSHRIAAGADHSVLVRDNGTVVAVGRNQQGQCNVKNWRNIVSVAAGDIYTVGIRHDGTVTATGDLSVSHWTNVVQVTAGKRHIVGLREDGTVVAAGYNQFQQCEVNHWKDIVAIAAGAFHTLGLQKNGTVISAGANNGGVCSVGDWKQIAAIDTDHTLTAGIQQDGTVKIKSCGYSSHKHINTWSNAADVSVGFHTGAVLQKDGTVLISPYEKWENIVAISAGGDHILGLSRNGIVLASGENRYGQCNINGMSIHIG